MPDPHVIRLRGPWDCEPLERFDGAGELPAGGRVKPPCDWAATLGREFLGRVRYTRRFNRPTNIDPHEHVWLACDGVDQRATVALNGHALGNLTGHRGTTRFDVTSLLELHNTLWVDVTLDRATFHDRDLRGERAGDAGGLVGEVRLEIGQ
jgi:hypothetical protein